MEAEINDMIEQAHEERVETLVHSAISLFGSWKSKLSNQTFGEFIRQVVYGIHPLVKRYPVAQSAAGAYQQKARIYNVDIVSPEKSFTAFLPTDYMSLSFANPTEWVSLVDGIITDLSKTKGRVYTGTLRKNPVIIRPRFRITRGKSSTRIEMANGSTVGAGPVGYYYMDIVDQARGKNFIVYLYKYGGHPRTRL